jgi:hypothetical protein
MFLMKPIPLFMCMFLAAMVPVPAQQWEVGGGVGYGFSRGVDVTNINGAVRAGFNRGLMFDVYGAQNGKRLSGELRYAYKFSDLQVEGQGQKATFSGEVHSVHYDFLLHFSERKLQPYIAMGAGIRYFRGTGPQTAIQPLGTFAVLTHTNQVKPLLTPGVGIKAKLSERWTFRVDFRDYITPFPEQVITPYPLTQSEAHGWLHDFTPMVNIGITF